MGPCVIVHGRILFFSMGIQQNGSKLEEEGKGVRLLCGSGVDTVALRTLSFEP